jgi:hypothetical protein
VYEPFVVIVGLPVVEAAAVNELMITTPEPPNPPVKVPVSLRVPPPPPPVFAVPSPPFKF